MCDDNEDEDEDEDDDENEDMNGLKIEMENGIYLANQKVQVKCSMENGSYPQRSTNHGIELRVYLEGAFDAGISKKWECDSRETEHYADIQKELRALLQQAEISAPWGVFTELEGIADDADGEGPKNMTWTAGVRYKVAYGRTYMLNGVIYSDVEHGQYDVCGADTYAIHGWEDSIWERGNQGGFVASTKPQYTEIAMEHSLYIRSSISIINDELTATCNLQYLPGAGKLASAGRVYIDNSHDKYILMFSNRFGIPETITVKAKPSVSYKVQGEMYERSSPASETEGRDSMYIFRGSNKEWEMSSGPVNEAWAEWFSKEFVRGRKCYMLIDGVWEAVEIFAEGERTIREYGKAEACSVQFKARRIMDGSNASKPASVDSNYNGNDTIAHVIRFTNPFGTKEEIKTESLFVKSSQTDSAKYRRGSDEPQDSVNVSNMIHTKYKMSTGPVSEKVAEWYATNFFSGSEHEMMINGRWMPVTVVPGSSVQIRNHGKAEACSVEFKVVVAREY